MCFFQRIDWKFVISTEMPDEIVLPIIENVKG